MYRVKNEKHLIFSYYYSTVNRQGQSDFTHFLITELMRKFKIVKYQLLSSKCYEIHILPKLQNDSWLDNSIKNFENNLL